MPSGSCISNVYPKEIAWSAFAGNLRRDLMSGNGPGRRVALDERVYHCTKTLNSLQPLVHRSFLWLSFFVVLCSIFLGGLRRSQPSPRLRVPNCARSLLGQSGSHWQQHSEAA